MVLLSIMPKLSNIMKDSKMLYEKCKIMVVRCVNNISLHGVEKQFNDFCYFYKHNIHFNLNISMFI